MLRKIMGPKFEDWIWQLGSNKDNYSEKTKKCGHNEKSGFVLHSIGWNIIKKKTVLRKILNKFKGFLESVKKK